MGLTTYVVEPAARLHQRLELASALPAIRC